MDLTKGDKAPSFKTKDQNGNTVSLSDFDGESLATRFYTPYVLNGLQVISDKQVTCKIKGDKKPLIFESNSDTYDFIYLVMPVSSQNR